MNSGRLLLPLEEKEIKKLSKKKCNQLSGAEWLRYSMSVWDDIKKTKEEMKLKHPAMFPEMLIKRLLLSYTSNEEKTVLDPFMGSGSTLIAAYKLGKLGIGIDIAQEYIDLAKERLQQIEMNFEAQDIELIEPKLYRGDAKNISEIINNEVDICITSPPYWDILEQKRTADGKEIRNYGDNIKDLGKIDEYDKFLFELNQVWKGIFTVLKPGGYMIVNVMDLRKKDRFYPLHIDLITKITKLNYPSFDLDDIIIWNRQREYSNLRPLGYPFKFRINKIHEYLLVFEKPKSIKSFVKKWKV